MSRPVLIAALVAAASPIVVAQPAPDTGATAQQAADRRQANALFKEGVRLFNATQFTDALDLFQTAYKRYPDARILYSIASTLRQLGRSVPAANAYQRYIDDPGAEPQFVADAKTVLHVLDATVGTVNLTFDGDAGEIQVGDEWLPAGVKIVRVDPGDFILHARKAHATAEATGKVLPGTVVDVAIKWTPEAVKPVLVTTPPPKPVDKPLPPPPEQHSPILAYSLAGGGAALGVIAIILEVSSRSKVSDAQTICGGAALACGEPSYSQATSDLDGARTLRNVAIGLGVVGVGALATGVYLYLHDRSAKPRHESALRIVPTSSDRAVGVLLDGRF